MGASGTYKSRRNLAAGGGETKQRPTLAERDLAAGVDPELVRTRMLRGNYRVRELPPDPDPSVSIR